MAETRAHSLIDINRRMDDSSKLAEERFQLTDERFQCTENAIQETTTKISNMQRLLQILLTNQQHLASPVYDPSSSTPPQDSSHSHPPLNPGVLSTTKQPPDPNKTFLPNCGLSTRLPKIEFPKFNGLMLNEWLFKCEEFFALDNTAADMKVRLASLHLEGKAFQWHHNCTKSSGNKIILWLDYAMAISNRFGKLVDDPLADLVSLKQSTLSVENYLDQFESHLTGISLADEHALSIFLTNLNTHIAMHVRQFKPQTVTDAARIAKLHESARPPP